MILALLSPGIGFDLDQGCQTVCGMANHHGALFSEVSAQKPAKNSPHQSAKDAGEERSIEAHSSDSDSQYEESGASSKDEPDSRVGIDDGIGVLVDACGDFLCFDWVEFHCILVPCHREGEKESPGVWGTLVEVGMVGNHPEQNLVFPLSASGRRGGPRSAGQSGDFSCRSILPQPAPLHGLVAGEGDRLGAWWAWSLITREVVIPQRMEVASMASTLVPSFLSALSQMGIRQIEIARLLGCSESQVSRLRSGERTLPLEDLRGLLKRLVREYPAAREQLVRVAVEPLLEGTGMVLVVQSSPPPSEPAAGRVIELAAWRCERRHRMAA